MDALMLSILVSIRSHGASRVRYARTTAKRGFNTEARAASIEWFRWSRSIALMESRMDVRCVWCSEALRTLGACAEVARGVADMAVCIFLELYQCLYNIFCYKSVIKEKSDNKIY